ncbi:15129_t:CDS:1 [Dentiscutata heterogama]|uniref:15129_t:CDS:1 n=1 Tax=Dentiscutata heterogama TaxID=1316150 RepID=A0ACA9KGL8_9GLOM|nr:15129_t:CDS:1 [Dentiscutata heterogama]
MLCRLIAHNDQIPLTPSNVTRFHSRATPSITVSDYLRRIVKYTSLERSCLLILLLYIDRVCENNAFTITSLTVHRFIIAAVTVSSKALCDSYCTNTHYARVGGISTQELNTLELEFLKLIGWQLICTSETLQQYYVNLVKQNSLYRRAVTTDSDSYGTSIMMDVISDPGQ